MSVHRYPAAAALADYVRAGVGVGIAAVPLVLGNPPTAVSVLLAVVIGVFTVHGLRTIGRQLTRIEVDDHGIRGRSPIAGDLAWREVRRVKLTYYSTRRDRTGGWLQLSLGGRPSRFDIDSRLFDFNQLAAHAAAAAVDNGIELDPATVFNFHALGIPIADRQTAEDDR